MQPSRITDYHTTLIDNINNLLDETKSGNIFITLSEHFSRFVSVRREKIDFKKVKIHKRDFSKFENDLFRDDVSIQNWNLSFDNVNDQFNDFFWKITGCVDRHAPIKELTPKEIKLKSKPWITPNINKVIRKKRQPNREIKKSKKNHFNFQENSSNIYININIS